MKLLTALILATMMLGAMLLSGVVLAKNIKGDARNDHLTGTNGTDNIKGNGGADHINGKKGADTISGGKGADRLRGGRSNDWISGDPDFDIAWGNQGGDDLFAEDERPGSLQAAKIKGGRKPDKLLGGPGNDTFRARNGKKDIIRGGPGYDKSYVDKVDKVQGVETEVVPGGGDGPPQCNDGIDNDNEGAADFPDDPGCTSPTDNTESPNPQEPKKQCNDGIDNDGDGKIDLQDPGCASASDDTESPNPEVQCNDGIDNDGDGKIDFGTGANNDPGCDSLTDDTENTPPKNTPPVANDDTYSVPSCRSSQKKGILNVAAPGVLDNDSDADGNTLSASVDSPPTRGGHLTLNADGSFTYEIPDGCTSPSTTFGGDSFTYKATDSAGDSDVAKVSLTP
jgi:Bacterial cadherin-like domain/RTX calcium-binding nonapeptide repeat (4 copies)